jgi:hypothetical protein
VTDRPDNPPATLDDAVLEQLQALLKAGGPAFPFSDPPGSRPTRIFPGMTILDWFAGQALEGCVEKQFSDALLARLGSTEAVSAAIAGAAYQIADACLLARRGGVDPLFGMIEQRDALLAACAAAANELSRLQDVLLLKYEDRGKGTPSLEVLLQLNAAIALARRPS